MVSKTAALLALVMLVGCSPTMKLELADVEARATLNSVIELVNENEARIAECCPQEVEDASSANQPD